jgi:GT2 family glycosyltransferase
VNYYTAKLTENCILSVREKSQGFSYEILVVDNSNDEKEFSSLTNFFNGWENLSVINPRNNLGWGGANNLAAVRASGNYLLLLNSDTILKNNAIGYMFSFLKRNPEVGAVGANLFSKEGKPTHSFIKNEMTVNEFKKSRSILRHLGKRGALSYQFNFSDKPLQIDGYLSGACLLVPKKIFEKIGGFDKEIFMYGEDDLFCSLIKKEGWLLVNLPQAQATHLEGGSEQSVFSAKKIKNIVNGTYIKYLRLYGECEAKRFLKTAEKVYFFCSIRNFLFFRKTSALNYFHLSHEYKIFYRQNALYSKNNSD